jgi:cell division protein FtsB
MTIVEHIRIRMRRAIMPACAIALLGYFVYHAVQGDVGLVAWWRLNQQIAAAQDELAIASAVRDDWERRVRQLQPEHLDPDMIEERARYMLNLVNPDDRIIPIARPLN